MASLRKRKNGHWQACFRNVNQSISKTFINKVDAERWAKQVEVDMQKGSYTNLVLAERTTLGELIDRQVHRRSYTEHARCIGR